MGVSPARPLFGLAAVFFITACAGESEPSAPERTDAATPDCDAILAEAESRAKAIAEDQKLSDEDRAIATTRVWSQTGQCDVRPMAPGEPDPGDISKELAEHYREAMAAARSVRDPDAECRSQIGDRHADALEAICASVSGATHPPCNAANTCELLVEEVERNCDSLMVERYPNLCSAAGPD